MRNLNNLYFNIYPKLLAEKYYYAVDLKHFDPV